MKKYKYVVVSGCSFSASDDPGLPNPEELYGGLIAKHFNAKSYNLAKCGGTVYSVNRTILEWCGKNKDKFEDTLVILGMPHLDRWTLWSNLFKQWVNINTNFLTSPHLNEFFYSFNTQDMEKYVKNSWNENDQLRSAINIIVGLQSFFKVSNIDHVFFDALDTSLSDFWTRRCDDKKDRLGHKLLFDSFVSQENWYTHPEYYSMADFIGKNLELRLTKDDPHPNKEAHKFWGEYLIEFIDEKINI